MHSLYCIYTPVSGVPPSGVGRVGRDSIEHDVEVASVLVGALTIGLQGVVWSVIRSRNDLLSSGAVVAPAAR
jgi:hypothetical protein